MIRIGAVGFLNARPLAYGLDRDPRVALRLDLPSVCAELLHSGDIDLGLVPVTWSLEEFAATYDDDDVKFVGQIDAKTGLFTPNVDGPNPARRGSRNNVGDVYAVAAYTTEPLDGKPAKTLRGRGHLLVTVPLYMRWEEPGAQP